jgi:hypothetical protein
MIQDSWLRPAWVSRAIEGIAAFSEATAETTVGTARQVTGGSARRAARLASVAVVVIVSLPPPKISSLMNSV